MSSRPRRAIPPPSPIASTSRTRSRPSRQSIAKIEPEDDDNNNDDDEDEEQIVSSSYPKRSRATALTKANKRGGNNRGSIIAKEEDGTDVEGSNEDVGPVSGGGRRRATKRVSYKEVPIDLELEEEAEDDDPEPGLPDNPDDEDQDQDEEEEEEQEEIISTSRKRKTSVGGTPNDEDESKDKDKPYRREPMASGRGGFSVKGAAAAAARARWEKVRREKAERGDESDGAERRRRDKDRGRRENRAALDTVEMESIIRIKGVDYTVGDDELILPDDVKGETKIDAEGHLLGGREYKLVTFTSPTRRNPNRIYALTIDAARACGYSDSLAFLRRCPQLIKLACNADERQMLIDIGRVTGNLKHRMVTMVAMRNIYKIMGARVVKNGKWVTDDYNEEEGLAQCVTNNWTPHTPAEEDDILANALQTQNLPGRPARMIDELSHPQSRQTQSFSSLQPFYTVGGAGTQFGGNGRDPWSDAGWGNKRAKLKGAGVSEVDWMWKLAGECRRVDGYLRECREERLGLLEGVDGVRGWVYSAEQGVEIPSSSGNSAATQQISTFNQDDKPSFDSVMETSLAQLKPQAMTRIRSQLSQEVSYRATPESGTPMEVIGEDMDVDTDVEGKLGDEHDGDEDGDGDGDGDGEGKEVAVVDTTPGGKVVVQTLEEDLKREKEFGKVIGGSWKPGIVYAAYEPHTQIPHIPQSTQPPSTTSYTKLSHIPLLLSLPPQSLINRKSVEGLATVEYVLEGGLDGGAEAEAEKRRREVQEAEDWARGMRERKRVGFA